jgi:nucleotide-binding universal stress UspA family protein
LRTAVSEARLRGAELRLVHAWDRHQGEATAHALRHAAEDVAALLARGTARGTGALTVSLPRAGTSARSLLGEASDAELVIVGGLPDGRGGVAGGLARAVIAGAACPVLLIPDAR